MAQKSFFGGHGVFFLYITFLNDKSVANNYKNVIFTTFLVPEKKDIDVKKYHLYVASVNFLFNLNRPEFCVFFSYLK
jgi:hypothetical protein